jgi:predicted Zn-dependent protease
MIFYSATASDSFVLVGRLLSFCRSHSPEFRLCVRRNLPCRHRLSLVLCIERHFDEAEAAARATLEIDANDPMGHYALALVMYATGRIPDAEKGTLEALRLRPKFPEAYLLLAQVHARQDNPAAVVADLDAYLRLDGISPRAEKARSARAGAQNTLLHQSSGSALAKINP